MFCIEVQYTALLLAYVHRPWWNSRLDIALDLLVSRARVEGGTAKGRLLTRREWESQLDDNDNVRGVVHPKKYTRLYGNGI